MGKVSRAYPHVWEEDLRTQTKGARDPKTAQKLLVILNATVAPRPAKEIALHTGVSFIGSTIGSRPTTASVLKASSVREPHDGEKRT